MIEFRVVDAPDQQFGAILGGRRCTIRLRYNVWYRRWMFDLAIDDDWVIMGRRVVLGTDLLSPFDLGIGRLFAMVESENNQGAMPDYDNLVRGIVKLYHAPEEEVVAAVSA